MPTIPLGLPKNPTKPKNRRKRKSWRDMTPEQKALRRSRRRTNTRQAPDTTELEARRLVRMSLSGPSSSIFPPHVHPDADVAKSVLALSRAGSSRYQQMVAAKDLYEALSQGKELGEDLKAVARFLKLKPNPSQHEVEALLRDLLRRGENERPRQRQLRRQAFRMPRPKNKG